MKETSMIKSTNSFNAAMKLSFLWRLSIVGLYENTSDLVRNQLNYVKIYQLLILNILLLKVTLFVLNNTDCISLFWCWLSDRYLSKFPSEIL